MSVAIEMVFVVFFFLSSLIVTVTLKNRVSYCIAVGEQRISITESSEGGCSSKNSLCRISVSPLSVLRASSVTMTTVDGRLFLLIHFFVLLLPLIVAPLQFESFALRLEWGETQNDTSVVCRWPFSIWHQIPSLRSCFCPHAYFGHCMLGSFIFLFVWHLAVVPQREVHSVAVAQIKGYWALNHYINT